MSDPLARTLGMTQTYSIHEAAAHLAVTFERATELAALVWPQPPERYSFQDLDLLRTAKRLRDRKISASTVTHAVGRTRRPLLSLVAPPTWPRPLPDRDAELFFERAVQLEQEKPAQAIDAYEEAVAADPCHADAHVNLGRLLHAHGRLREAEAHYVAALVCRPTDATATFNLAVVLEDLGRIDDALKRYRDAIELDPDCVDAYFNLSRLYEKKGEKMAALRHLKDYRRLSKGG